MLERALIIRSKDGTDPMELADTEYHLARALWSERAQRARALELAREARAGYAKAGKRATAELAATQEWLAKHR